MFEKSTNDLYVSDERAGHLVRYQQPAHGLDFSDDIALGQLNFQGSFDKIWTNRKMEMVNSFDVTLDSVYLTSPHTHTIVRYNRTNGEYITHFDDPELHRPATVKAYKSALYVCSVDKVQVYERITTEYLRGFISKPGLSCASMIFHEHWTQNQGFD
jgi:hypothetical protein